MGHQVGEAAARAVKNSNKSGAVVLTQKERIKNIRGLLAAKLAVPPDEQRFLLEQYDLYVQKRDWLASAVQSSIGTSELLQEQVKELKELNASQSTMIVKLQEENEQFRSVYEIENSSRGTVQVIAEVPYEGLS